MALTALLRRILTVALADQGAAKELADAVDTNTTATGAGGNAGLSANNAFTGNNTHAGTETFTAQVAITDANVALSAATGTSIGTAASQKLSFHGSGPTAQRAGAAQAAAAATAATNSSPYGYSQAQADAIVTLLNELRAALVEKGLIKGAA